MIYYKVIRKALKTITQRKKKAGNFPLSWCLLLSFISPPSYSRKSRRGLCPR